MRAILGGMSGFLGISLEFFGLITVCPLLKPKMPRGAKFYKLSMFVYLAVAGEAVHLPCGVFLWLCRLVTAAAGRQAGLDLVIFMGVFNAVRRIGNYAVINGIGTSNKSLGGIIVFLALLVGFRKYVTEEYLQAATE